MQFLLLQHNQQAGNGIKRQSLQLHDILRLYDEGVVESMNRGFVKDCPPSGFLVDNPLLPTNLNSFVSVAIRASDDHYFPQVRSS
jgi:hypothetical protein